MAKTHWQKLQAAKKRWCAGKITKAQFNKIAKKYKDDAVKKGNKTKAQADAAVKKLEKKACSASSKSKSKSKAKVGSAGRKRKTRRRA